MAVQRDITLAEMTGGRLHVAHLSTCGAMEAVRNAKAKGVRVTCEVTPHHLFLTDEAVREYDSGTKMAPPLRAEEDRQALLEGLADGTVDTIATDHAPHHPDEKTVEFDNAAFGIVGLETAVPLCLDRLVAGKLISLTRLIELLAVNPAGILGLQKGTLSVGSDADLTLLDLDKSHIVDPGRFQSKGQNTPFGGWELRGQAVMTIVGGQVAWKAA
jgi:dihydroorotase